MFWKTTAVALAASAVFSFGCNGTGKRAGVPPAAAPGQEAANELIPPGVEATAFLGNVPPGVRFLAPALIYEVGPKLASSATFKEMPPELRFRLSRDLRRHVSARPVGPPDWAMLAIDVRATGNSKQAETLARAVAECYLQHIRPSRTGEIDRLRDEQQQVRSRLDRARRALADVRSGGPLAAMRERQNLVSIRLEALARKLLEAELAQGRAAAALKMHEQRVREGTAAKDPQVRQALEADPVLQRLDLQVTELKAKLAAAAAKTGPQHQAVKDLQAEMESLERHAHARREEVVQARIEAIGQERQMTYAVLTQELADLKDRLAGAKAEARDLEQRLGEIAALEAEKRRLSDAADRIEQRLWELGLAPGDRRGEPALLGVVVGK